MLFRSLYKGAFPELEFGDRASLRGLWRLRRDCEGEVIEDVVRDCVAFGVDRACD